MLRRSKKLVKKLIAEAGLLSAELVIVLVLFILSLVVFSYLVKEVFVDKEVQFDLRVFNWLKTYITPFNTVMMKSITFLGTHIFLIPANILLTAYFLVIRKHRWYSIKVSVIALSSVTMMFLLKHLFLRQRPLVPLLRPAMGYSFPSGHSMMSFSFYGLLIYLCYRYVINPYLKWMLIMLLATLIVLIGLSRIYLRVHYASDVLAGFSTGIIWLVFSLWSLNKLEEYSKRKITPVIEA